MSRPADMSFWTAGAWFFWDLAKYLLITAAVFATVASTLLLIQYALLAALWACVSIAASAMLMVLPAVDTLLFFGIASIASLSISSVVILLSGLSAGLSGICQLGDTLSSCCSFSEERDGDWNEINKERHVFN